MRRLYQLKKEIGIEQIRRGKNLAYMEETGGDPSVLATRLNNRLTQGLILLDQKGFAKANEFPDMFLRRGLDLGKFAGWLGKALGRLKDASLLLPCVPMGQDVVAHVAHGILLLDIARFEFIVHGGRDRENTFTIFLGQLLCRDGHELLNGLLDKGMSDGWSLSMKGLDFASHHGLADFMVECTVGVVIGITILLLLLLLLSFQCS